MRLDESTSKDNKKANHRTAKHTFDKPSMDFHKYLNNTVQPHHSRDPPNTPSEYHIPSPHPLNLMHKPPLPQCVDCWDVLSTPDFLSSQSIQSNENIYIRVLTYRHILDLSRRHIGGDSYFVRRNNLYRSSCRNYH